MSRDASGNYNLPAGNPVVSGTVITTAWANPTMADLGSALTDSLSRTGKGGMGAALAMGGFKINALAAGMLATDAPQATQVRDSSFSWLNPVSSDVNGNDYLGTALLGTPPINGSLFMFLADKNNTGPMTLSVNAGASLPILIHNTPVSAGLILAGDIVEVVFVTGSYRIASTAGIGGTVTAVNSSNIPVLTSTYNTLLRTVTLTPNVNVPNGGVQLDGSSKVPIAQLPFTDLQFIGAWNAGPGINPAAATNGQFYIIVGAGNLTIFRNSGGNVYTAQVTACVVGDAIIFNTAGTVNQPVGWYYDPAAAAPAVAGTVTITATPTLPAVTVLQTWLNQMDPIIAAKLPLAGGTMTGAILQPLTPGTALALANKQYVDDKVASLPAPVVSFNTRVGVITLLSSDVLSALGYTPANVAGQTFTGAITAPSATVTNSLTAKQYIQTPLIAAAAAVIDFANGQSQILTLAAPLVITNINNVPTGTILRLVLKATNFAVTWPATVKWPLGVTPDLSLGPLKKAVVVLENDGTELLGSHTAY